MAQIHSGPMAGAGRKTAEGAPGGEISAPLPRPAGTTPLLGDGEIPMAEVCGKEGKGEGLPLHLHPSHEEASIPLKT